LFCCFVDTNIQPYFELANFFKDIFQLFSKTLIIIENKTAANSTYAPLKRAHSCITVSTNLFIQYVFIDLYSSFLTPAAIISNHFLLSVRCRVFIVAFFVLRNNAGGGVQMIGSGVGGGG